MIKDVRGSYQLGMNWNIWNPSANVNYAHRLLLKGDVTHLAICINNAHMAWCVTGVWDSENNLFVWDIFRHGEKKKMKHNDW